ncbi:hypothetical protein AAHK20_29290 [Trinickia sp. YCB016]
MAETPIQLRFDAVGLQLIRDRACDRLGEEQHLRRRNARRAALQNRVAGMQI